MEYRIERDSIGEISVPANSYWGAQTERSRNNFQIGNQIMPMGVIQAYAIIKKSAAHTNHALGVLNEEKKMLITKVCDEILCGELNEHFPLSVWQTGSGTQTNMNVNEVIANRAQVIQGGKLTDTDKVLHPNDDVNKSQSSNDTFPTAMHIATYKIILEKVIPSLQQLESVFTKKAKEFYHVVKIGRTHFMDATPITLGQELSSFSTQILHGIQAIKNSLPLLAQIPLGGTAVGTGINTPKGYDTMVASKISEYTGIPFTSAKNKFESISSHDVIIEVHGAIKRVAVSFMKIANDIRMLASGPRAGIGEVKIPANEPGSSIMPGKVNPTQTEAVTMLCAQIMGNDVAISIGGSQGHFQLNAFKPLIIYNLLVSAQLLADGAKSFCNNCITGLEPNTKRVQENLENSLMLVTALNTHIGYDNAAKIAKKSIHRRQKFKTSCFRIKFTNRN